MDKDLSFWLGESTDYDDNVFVTDEYSVENYVANAYGFETWLIHYEGFARASKPEIEFMVEEYNNVASRFQREMMPIMAQAVVAKRHNKSISLSEFKISKDNILFKIVNGHLSFDFQIDPDVFKKWGLTKIHNEEIKRQLYHFSEKKEFYSVRGKWYLRFMAEVGEYMRLNPDMFASSLGITKKIKPTCAVAPSECLTAIAPYFVKSTPPRLERFLDSTYRQYCLFFC